MGINKNVLNFKEIGARIRLEREKLDLSREKFAEIVNLSPYYIGQIERGDRAMSLDTLVKISSTLHLSVDYLLYGTDLYSENIEIAETFSVLETTNNIYDTEIDSELKELINILSRCSKKEINLIKDIIKLLLPHI